jgi:hypothetical protein
VTAGEEAREALLAAAEALLSGDAPGPLTGLRLVELAGVKRHRLTHDNPDIAKDFSERARELNRTKPQVDALRARLSDEKSRNSRLAAEVSVLSARLELYASRIDRLTVERDGLLDALDSKSNVTAIRRGE